MTGADRQRPTWPTWPIATPAKDAALRRVLESGRWAVSGDATGHTCEEQLFAREFADFTGAGHAIATDHGSSALHLALAAIGVGPGDEVIVPGLTWVACAASVAHRGAVPVFADIDRDTLCVSVESVESCFTSLTRAVLAVHLYCNVAPVNALAGWCEKRGVALIEDCAQAHGARLAKRHVGTFGVIGTFSMQQGKPMTSGEGGACVTDDDELADRIYRLRTDSRRFARTGQFGTELVSAPPLASSNRCLGEFQCALLREELADLPKLHARRARGAKTLRDELARIPGLDSRPPCVADADPAYYRLITSLGPDALRGRSIDSIAQRLAQRLGVGVHTVYEPLDASPLLDLTAFGLDPSRSVPVRLERCWDIRRTSIAFPHWMLLAKPHLLADVAEQLNSIIHPRGAT